MQDRTVNILGTKYTIKEDKNLVDANLDGQKSVLGHEITIRPFRKMLDAGDSETEKMACYREVMRHEIIHAFFKESGNEGYCENEHLVQTLAVLYPKINAVLAEIGVSS